MYKNEPLFSFYVVGSRIFGHSHKHLEAIFEKGVALKPIIAKKVLIGVGALGAGALAAGGAALIAKKLPHLHHGWGWSGGHNAHNHGYAQNQYATPSYGWQNSAGGYYQQQATGAVKYPTSSYPTASSSYDTSSYPSTSYGYPSPNDWQGSDNFGSGYGWSR